MARTQPEIKNSMTEAFMANPENIERYGLNPGNTFAQEFSNLTWENMLFDIVSFAFWTLETFFDIFTLEIKSEMAKQKVHSQEWYRQKALGFKYGLSIKPGTDEFITDGLDDEIILLASVIKQAACVKLISDTGYGILRIKVATLDITGKLCAIDADMLAAFRIYILRYVVDAGTQVKITTGDADKLKLTIDAYYDPLVLSTTGTRLDGTDDQPLQKALDRYLASLEFNGSLIIDELRTALKAVEGIRIANIKFAASKYGQYTYTTQGIANVGIIDEIRIADSGYMQIDTDELIINWKQMQA